MREAPIKEPTAAEIALARDVDNIRHLATLARRADDIFARRALQDTNYLQMVSLVFLTDVDAAAGRVALPYTRRRMPIRQCKAFSQHRAWLGRIAEDATEAAAFVEARAQPVPFAWAHAVTHLRTARKLAAHLVADAVSGDVQE